MFGAVCSGRPIQLADQVEPTKYVLTIPNASNVSHIAVFLLPNSEFTDPQYTALVYFQMPGSQEFKLLGGLNPLKQSSIFKLNNTSKSVRSGDDTDMNIDDSVLDNDTAVINVGISIEPSSQAEQLLLQEKQKQAAQSKSLVLASSANTQAPRNANDIALLANKIVGHAYNYLGSFIDNSGKVSMKAFDSWWDKFRAKLANNPNFLDELQQ